MIVAIWVFEIAGKLEIQLLAFRRIVVTISETYKSKHLEQLQMQAFWKCIEFGRSQPTYELHVSFLPPAGIMVMMIVGGTMNYNYDLGNYVS